MSMQDILANAALAAAVSRLTKAASKNGVDRAEAEAIFKAVLNRHYPMPSVSSVSKP